MKIPKSPEERLQLAIEFAWNVFFENIVEKNLRINKESSMQLHFSKYIERFGELFCIKPGEKFWIEMESGYISESLNRLINIDITCGINDTKASIELKCFRKESNRARDIDMYSVLVDIERLQGLNGFMVKKFICLADDVYYANSSHKGKAGSVTIKDGTVYKAGIEIVPDWIGKWKNNKDKSVIFTKEINFHWKGEENWRYLYMDI